MIRMLLAVAVLFVLPGLVQATTRPCFVDKVVMIFYSDLGHGGESRRYEIIYQKDRYEVTLSIWRNFSRLGESDIKPSRKEKHIEKSSKQVLAFTESLVKGFHLFERESLQTKTLLHPTTYEFEIRDSCNKAHSFKYTIEGNNHINKDYEDLVKTFISFFES